MHSRTLLVGLLLLVTAGAGHACGGNTTSQQDGSGGSAGAAQGVGGEGTGGLPTDDGGAGVGGVSAGSTGRGGASTGTGGASAGMGAVAGAGGAAPERCSLPLDSGSCRGYQVVFGYAPEIGRCESFVYGGCEGNANRFETLEGCMAACDAESRSCDGHGECILQSAVCCGPCEPVRGSSLRAVNEKYLTLDQCGDIVCGPCPDVGVPEFPNFRALCLEKTCELVDIRETPDVLCMTDTDCQLRNGLECCELCSGSAWVAVAKGVDLVPRLCEEAVECDACVAVPPADYSAICQEGRCAVAGPP